MSGDCPNARGEFSRREFEILLHRCATSILHEGGKMRDGNLLGWTMHPCLLFGNLID
jgi:hypothetical protein